MLDHIGVTVSNVERARAFYLAALAPLGYSVLMEGEGYCGIGQSTGEHAWIGTIWLNTKEGLTPNHIAFRVNDRATVDAFYKVALAAGGKDNGAPGIRAHYHENYYAAFVLDQDGNNVEVVCHKAE
jgi:catechol 2,3-dioxygenase-like lactoylglutathione lyase family enzyme